MGALRVRLPGQAVYTAYRHTQELNYRFVAKTIAALGFTGYIAHEWRPSPGNDPIENLRRVREIMDV